MSQHDYSIGNAAGGTVRGDLNGAFEAVVTLNSGASAPSVTFPYMLWFDETNSLLKIRDGSNANWVTVLSLASTALTWPGPFTVTLNDNGAGAGPDLILQRISATSAVSDSLAALRWYFSDSAGNVDQGASIFGEIAVPTSGNESVVLGIITRQGGADVARLMVGAGVYTPGVAGGDPGAGKMNVGELQIGGATLTSASQAQMEAASATSVFASPGNLRHHPGVVKAWARFNGTGTAAIAASHNISSLTDNGVGDWTLSFSTNIASNGCAVATSNQISTELESLTSAGVRVRCRDSNANLVDASLICVTVLGDFP